VEQQPGKKGIALLIVLVIIVMSSAMIAVIIFFVMRGTEYTALQKKYATSKEASIGALEVLTKEIIPLAISGINLTTLNCSAGTCLSDVLASFSVITAASVTQVGDVATSNSCFSKKLLSAPPWTGCDSTLDVKISPDVKFTLSGAAPAQPFDVYAKIVDTAAGNTNTSGLVLEGMGAAESAGGIITTRHFPYMYTIGVQGERQNNPAERVNLEVLYAY